MSTKLAYPLLLCLACVLVLLPGLGAYRFVDQDEGFFAGAAAEMYARGDWIVPYFNGELFAHKPPGMYWAMMSGFSLFGVNEFAARFGSALFGAGATLLTYDLGRRLFSPLAGALAGLVLVTSIMFNGVSRAASPDSYLVFFTTLALWVFVRHGLCRSYDAENSEDPGEIDPTRVLPQRWSSYALMYAAMAGGVLVKGPIGCFFPMAVIGLFLLCATPRRPLPAGASWLAKLREAARPFGPVNFVRTVWRMCPLTAAVIVLAITAPWFLAVEVRTGGAFLREFFGVHHFERFSSAMDDHNGGPFYYVLATLAGMFPWSMFAVPALLFAMQSWRAGKRSWQWTFLACWAGVYLGIFSLAATKLPNYVLPAYPPLAILCGTLLEQWTCDRGRVSLGWLRTSCTLLAVFGLLFAMGLPLAASTHLSGETLLDRVMLPRDLQIELARLAWVGLPMLAGGCAALVLSWRRNGGPAVASLAVTSVALSLVFWSLAPQLDRFQTPQEIAARSRRYLGAPNTVLAQFRVRQPTMVYYAGERISACPTPEAARQFFTHYPHGLLIITSERLPEVNAHWPADVEVLERQSAFPRPGELLLLGRRSQLAAEGSVAAKPVAGELKR